MKKTIYTSCIAMAVVAFTTASAAAQMGKPAQPQEPSMVAPAPAAPGPVPSIASPRPTPAPVNTQKGGGPLVKLCTKGDVRGLWKLVRVFETPAGDWSADYKAHPQQFVWFAKALSNSYYEIKGTEKYNSKEEITDQMKATAGQVPQQFVVGDKGALYYYRNGKSERSVYCGIVQKKQPPYNKGDMVLTPTQASGTHLYLLYRHPRLPKTTKPNRAFQQ